MALTKTYEQWRALFSKNLKALIKKSGLTEQQYRKAAGMETQPFYNYINALRIPKNPSDIETLARVAGASPADLFGWKTGLNNDLTLHCIEISIKSGQAGIAAGSTLFVNPDIVGPVDGGLYAFGSHENPILRRVKILVSGQIDVEGETYSPNEFTALPKLGRAISALSPV